MIDNPPTVDSLPLVMRGEAWQSRLAQMCLKSEFFGDRQVSDGSIDIRLSSSGARLARAHERWTDPVQRARVVVTAAA